MIPKTTDKAIKSILGIEFQLDSKSTNIFLLSSEDFLKLMIFDEGIRACHEKPNLHRQQSFYHSFPAID